MFFHLLSTLTRDTILTLRGTWGFYLNHVIPLIPFKSVFDKVPQRSSIPSLSSSQKFRSECLLLISIFLQIFDLEDLSLDEATRKKKNKKSPLGRDRSIVIARADYTLESPDNIKLIYDKLRVRETMKHYSDWQIIGDLKANNSTCGA